MAVVNSSYIGADILKLLGVEDSNIIEAHIHIVRESAITVDIIRYATRKDGKMELTENEMEIKKELKRYHLIETKEDFSKDELTSKQ